MRRDVQQQVELARAAGGERVADAHDHRVLEEGEDLADRREEGAHRQLRRAIGRREVLLDRHRHDGRLEDGGGDDARKHEHAERAQRDLERRERAATALLLRLFLLPEKPKRLQAEDSLHENHADHVGHEEEGEDEVGDAALALVELRRGLAARATTAVRVVAGTVGVVDTHGRRVARHVDQGAVLHDAAVGVEVLEREGARGGVEGTGHGARCT